VIDPDRYNPFGESCLILPLDRPVPPFAPPPCPVIGVGAETARAAPLCDVLVPDTAALAGVVSAIQATPIAAAVLAQVLRMTLRLPLHDALVLESMAYASLQGGAENRAWLAARSPPPPPLAEGGPPVLIARDSATLALTLNRPASRNPLSTPLRDALTEALQLPALDTSITRVTLNAAGKCFSIGGALEEFGTAPDQATAHAVRCTRGPAFALAAIAPRVHASVHGACIGAGAELASLCGQVTAHPRGFFQLPELRFGLIPGAGGTAGFARRIGRQRTAWLALTGRRLSARQALAWGLIDALSPP
jgi:hypothetical protein